MFFKPSALVVSEEERLQKLSKQTREHLRLSEISSQNSAKVSTDGRDRTLHIGNDHAFNAKEYRKGETRCRSARKRYIIERGPEKMTRLKPSLEQKTMAAPKTLIHEENYCGVQAALISSGHNPISGSHCFLCLGRCVARAPIFTAKGLLSQKETGNYPLEKALSFIDVVSYATRQIGINTTEHTWTIYDVPGDGNCWVYSLCLSMHLFNIATCGNGDGSLQVIEPQYIICKISDIVREIGRGKPVRFSERSYSIARSVLQLDGEESMAHFMSQEFDMSPADTIATIIGIGAPNMCTWAGTFGLEFTLAATAMNARIVTVTAQRNLGFRFKYKENFTNYADCARDIRESDNRARIWLPFSRPSLYVKTVSVCLSGLPPQSNQVDTIVVLHSYNNHFQSLKPPVGYDKCTLNAVLDQFDFKDYQHFY